MAVLSAIYGIRPWEIEQLTQWQLEALLNQYEWVTYIYDRPERDYHFSKLESDKLLDDTPADPVEAEKSLKARKIFYHGFYPSLPEFQTGGRLTRRAKDDLKEALKMEVLPNWVLRWLPTEDVKEVSDALRSEAKTKVLDNPR